jgi:hypothetical protein
LKIDVILWSFFVKWVRISIAEPSIGVLLYLPFLRSLLDPIIIIIIISFLNSVYKQPSTLFLWNKMLSCIFIHACTFIHNYRVWCELGLGHGIFCSLQFGGRRRFYQCRINGRILLERVFKVVRMDLDIMKVG